MRRAVRGTLLAGALALAAGVALAADTAAAVSVDAAIHRLDHADFVLADATPEPPPATARWQPRTLPDDWQATRPAACCYGWYRFRFDVDRAPTVLQAVRVPTMSIAGAVYVNGTFVGQSGEFEVVKRTVSSQLFVFRPDLLHAGGNELLVHLWAGSAITGGISALDVGDHAALAVLGQRERFLSETTAQIACVFAATTGVYSLLLWRLRRREATFLWFGLAACVNALWIATFNGLWEIAAVPGFFAAVGPPIGTALGGTLLVFYGLRFAGWRWPRSERAAWAWMAGVVALLALYMADSAAFLRWLPLHTFDVVLVPHLAALLLMVAIAVRRPGIESRLLLLGHLYSATLVVYGNYVGHLGGFNFTSTHLIPLLALMGWIVVRRFVGSLTGAERLNSELEQRVDDKRRELDDNYRKLQAAERASAIAEERGRIMSDMHDGIGGHLITALGLVEHAEVPREEIAASLRECIDDLRLIIDSLEPVDDDLLPLLGNLRYRIEGRFRQQGITLDWQVAELPRIAGFSPQNVLHVLRILQEAFTNALRHARATRIALTTRLDAGSVLLDVSDDGCGLAPEGRRGRGLGSMHDRARKVGGELRVTSSPGGTTLSLRLPLALQ